MKIANDFLRRRRSRRARVDTLSAQSQILTTANRVYDAISETKINGLDPELVLSLGLLLNFLSSLHEFLGSWSPKTSHFERDVFIQPPNHHIPQHLKEIPGGSVAHRLHHVQTMLIESGWCPYIVYQAYPGQSTEFLLFLLLLGTADRKEAHYNCDFLACSAYQIDPQRYVHSHARRGCQCNHVLVDSAQVCALLQAGQIPVIRIDTPQKGASLVVDAADEDTEYVAISHVWSDGLGNPGQNSIALCQFRRICRIVGMLPKQPIAIWLDTLCCPVQPLSMRRLAIKMMRKTYDEAAAVVALDARLTSVNIKNLSMVEIFARIMTSAWTKRLWTWQEGALALTLYFAFRDQLFCFDDLQNAPARIMPDNWAPHSDRYQYENDLFAFQASFSVSVSPPSLRRQPDLRYIVWGLVGRTTSVATDEALCLASLANISLERILGKRLEDRMLGFWEVFPDLPTCVIFWDVPRLEQPGFRWAPRTLLGLNYTARSYWKPYTKGSLSSRGLLVECRGALLLNAIDHTVGGGFWIIDGAGNCPFFVCGGSDEASTDPYWLHFERPLGNEPYTHAAILFDRGPGEVAYDEQFYPDANEVQVALVYVYRTEGGVIYARHSNRGTMIKRATALYHEFPAVDSLDGITDNSTDGSTRNILVDDVYRAIEWKVLPDDQRWCID